MSDASEDGDGRRSLLRAAGAVGALVGLAGCSGGDDGGADDARSARDGTDDRDRDADQSDGGTEPNSTEGDDSEQDSDEMLDDGDADQGGQDPQLLSAFEDVSFEDGELFVGLADDVELASVVLVDPLGQQVDRVSPERNERSAAFPLYDLGGGLSDSVSYEPGTYEVLGYKSSDATLIEGTETRDGLTLVARAEYTLEPEPDLRRVEPADEPGYADFVVGNDGSGPLPVKYRFLLPQWVVDPAENWQTTEIEIPPGEEAAITVDTRTAYEFDSDERDAATVEEETCTGETVDRRFDLYLDRDRIHRYEVTLALGGETAIEENAVTDDEARCTEISTE